MAEAQYYPSTSPGNVLVSGVEVENQDLALLGQVAGLSDDRVFAELFRLMPTDGNTVAKAIFPAGYFPTNGITPSIQAVVPTVQPTGSANASVFVNPFRVLLGSRTPLGTNTLQNWRDGRSSVFVNAVTTLSQSVAFAANSSGNPRWDLVYVALAVDTQTNQVTRRVKSAATSNVTAQQIYQYLAQVASLQTVQGTPGATPALPTLPADSGGVYNVPLAYVRIPNGFTALSTIAARDIREAAPIVPISRTTGAATLRAANGNNDGAGTYATNFGWAAGSAGTRPSVWIPESMIGKEELIIVIDANDPTPANWSHPPGSIVDSSVDWRNRVFKTHWAADGGVLGVFSNPGAGSSRVPMGAGNNPGNGAGPFLANSVNADASLMAGGATVTDLTHANNSSQAAGSQVGLYVNMSDGTLRWANVAGTAPACRFFFWIEASGPYLNY